MNIWWRWHQYIKINIRTSSLVIEQCMWYQLNWTIPPFVVFIIFHMFIILTCLNWNRIDAYITFYIARVHIVCVCARACGVWCVRACGVWCVRAWCVCVWVWCVCACGVVWCGVEFLQRFHVTIGVQWFFSSFQLMRRCGMKWWTCILQFWSVSRVVQIKCDMR